MTVPNELTRGASLVLVTNSSFFKTMPCVVVVMIVSNVVGNTVELVVELIVVVTTVVRIVGLMLKSLLSESRFSSRRLSGKPSTDSFHNVFSKAFCPLSSVTDSFSSSI